MDGWILLLFSLPLSFNTFSNAVLAAGRDRRILSIASQLLGADDEVDQIINQVI